MADLPRGNHPREDDGTQHREGDEWLTRTTGPGRGHNGGPPLEAEVLDYPNASWRLFCWRKAHRLAWKTPPPEITRRRLERAEALGMSYHAYTLEILERGRFL
jgi:hypothetical protein